VIRRPGTAVEPEEVRLTSVARVVDLTHMMSPLSLWGFEPQHVIAHMTRCLVVEPLDVKKLADIAQLVP
jgi:hypothetical protein